MRFAEPDTGISVGAESLLLRPTLRTACRLERRYNGFEPIARAVVDGSLSVIADVIYEGMTDKTLSRAAVEYALSMPLTRLDAVIPEVLTFVFSLCGLDDQNEQHPEPANTGRLETFENFHLTLYRLATGWLGWTPQVAWDATPAEILEAYKGRSEMLAALFGSASPEEEPRGFDNSQFDRSGFQKLKSLSNAVGGAV